MPRQLVLYIAKGGSDAIAAAAAGRRMIILQLMLVSDQLLFLFFFLYRLCVRYYLGNRIPTDEITKLHDTRYI
jgi:hypothetical protein